IRFQAISSLIEVEILERASPSVAAISSAVRGRSDRESRAWIWLTERLTPHWPPMSPPCSTKRSLALGSFPDFSLISVMTEISEKAESKSRGGQAPDGRLGLRPGLARVAPTALGTERVARRRRA